MADEVLAVEAVPLEEDFDTLVASLAIDDTLEYKLAKLKKNVDEKLADYVDVKHIEKDEDFKAAKKYRAAVNDVKKPIEAQRKAAKKKYSDLLKTFDKTIGEITAPIDALSDAYKAEIDRYEGECRARRLTALKGHYYDLAGEIGAAGAIRAHRRRQVAQRELRRGQGQERHRAPRGRAAAPVQVRQRPRLRGRVREGMGRGVVDEDPAGGLGRGGGCGRRCIARRSPRPPRSRRPTSPGRRRHSRRPSRNPSRCRPTPSPMPRRGT